LDRPKSANAIDARVGVRLKVARETAGMTQRTLAERMGLTFQQIQKYENGRNRIACSRLVELADTLGVAPAALLVGVGGRDALQQREDADELADATALLRAYARLSARGRRVLLQMASALEDELSPR
jgi:transcriptional regulator with XRE-family HTH domain